MRRALALTHVAFEDLGSLDAILRGRGFAVETLSVPGRLARPEARLDLLDPNLVIVLGGPIGVYETRAYPFLTREREALRDRLLAGEATLGLCLGAQLIASALGARVYPAPDKEIGFAPITLSEAGRGSPLAALADGAPVLHWHGDTFDLPDGATHLAASDLCENQAFSIGPRVLGLQFHLEVPPAAIEPWLVGHAVELAAAGIDPPRLRAEAAQADAALTRAANAVFNAWLDGAGF